MEIYIFGLGVFVVGLVVASVFFVNDEETKKYNDIDQANEADYDGMGNYGRFPEKKINYFLLASIKLFTKYIIANTDVAHIAKTRYNPAPPVSIDFGSLIPTKAKSITSVNNTAT